ncbi:MAG: DAK2 domain-containing protein [Lachnospiraceae bacterium]|nr:DAK2 domain-containing protein [Lachnospiraceae bacterium]
MSTIDATLLRDMFIAGSNALDEKKEYVNELNVFPVPDGDTGTNMTMTIKAAEREVQAVSDVTMENLCKAISSGSLRGARGNSGVILSQLLRGLTRCLREKEELDVQDIAEGFEKAVETAYKAVMKPKEGTILTVAKAGAYVAGYLADKNVDIVTFCELVIEYMREILNKTPDMLPVLKEAGVVDSGGEGLMVIIEGAVSALKERIAKPDGAKKPDMSRFDRNGYNNMSSGKSSKSSDKKNQEKKSSDKKSNKSDKSTRGDKKAIGRGSKRPSKANISTADIKFMYCTEFIVLLDSDFDIQKENEFKIFLEAIGDSIVVVSDDEIVKVHVHTNMPGIAIQKGLTYGALTNLKIDNMQEEHNERLSMEEEGATEAASAPEVSVDSETSTVVDENAGAANDDVVNSEGEAVAETPEKPSVPRKPVGFITVSAGEGLSEIFAGLGADIVIEGGQTMNPSTEDMINAIDKIDADNIFILPNNSNIILAASQASSLVEDKNIIVIPSKTIPQGIMALLNYMSNKTVEDNEATMIAEMANVKSGAVTYSIRDTVVQGMEIKQGDIMGIGESQIVNVGAQVMSVTVELVDKLIDDSSELVSLYYGTDTTEDEANLIADSISRKHPKVDVEVHYGGQPVYYYYLSVE